MFIWWGWLILTPTLPAATFVPDPHPKGLSGMTTYLRMLKMIRPYLTQVVAGVILMVFFSFFSVFSFTMLSPFLKALFTENQAQVEVAATPEAGSWPCSRGIAGR